MPRNLQGTRAPQQIDGSFLGENYHPKTKQRHPPFVPHWFIRIMCWLMRRARTDLPDDVVILFHKIC